MKESALEEGGAAWSRAQAWMKPAGPWAVLPVRTWERRLDRRSGAGDWRGVAACWRRAWCREEHGTGAPEEKELVSGLLGNGSPSLGWPGSVFPGRELIWN